MTDRQTHTDRQTNTDRQTQTDKHRQTDRQTQTNRQTQTDKHRQTDRHIFKYAYTVTNMCTSAYRFLAYIHSAVVTDIQTDKLMRLLLILSQSL